MRLFKKKIYPTPRSCPFCGGKPRLTKCGNHKEFWVVQCSECYETPVQFHEAKVSPKKAVKIWNDSANFAEYIIKVHNWQRASMTKFTSSEGD
jgi:hypothetical protein